MSSEVSVRRTITRARLADAAMEVFAERGVQGASVEQLCEAAGFTRGAFYSNYNNKNELCVAIVERRLDAHLQLAREAVVGLATRETPEPLSLDELLRISIHALLEANGGDGGERLPTLAAFEFRLHAVRDPSFRDEYQAIVDQTSAALLEMLTQVVLPHGYVMRVTPALAISIVEGAMDIGSLITELENRPVPLEVRVDLLVGMLTTLFVKTT